MADLEEKQRLVPTRPHLAHVLTNGYISNVGGVLDIDDDNKGSTSFAGNETTSNGSSLVGSSAMLLSCL